jgi:hypothetical protein
MGYKEKTVRVEFSDLGKGCYVVIKNPALRPLETTPALPDDPDERNAAFLEMAKSRIAGLITEWCMWDVDTDEELPLPSIDPNVFDRCPGVVLNRIGEEIQQRTNPTQP